MLDRLSIRMRVIGGFCILLALVAAFVLPGVNRDLQVLIESAERRELQVRFEELIGRIQAEQRLATSMATMVASQPHVQALLKAGDRKAVESELRQGFASLRDNFGLRQLQFHTPPATSWLRVHKPEKFGDDLSGFRQTVTNANASRSAVSGVEQGVAGLGIRGVVPINLQGEHWGTVEFGFSLGQPFVEQLKADTGVDVALMLWRSSRFESLASTWSGDIGIDTSLLKSAMDGEVQVGTADLKGRPVALYSRALTDFSGKPIGVVTLAMDRTDYIERYEHALLELVMIIVGFLVVGALVAWLISQSVARPLRNVERAMQDISRGEGDLTQRLPVKGNNELTAIAREFNYFIEQVEKLIQELMRSVASVSTSGSHLFDISDHTLELTNRQRQETTEIATAMNEMTATAQEVARSATGSAEVTQKADDQALLGREVVEEAIASIHALADDVTAMMSVIRDVESRSERINSILDVIREIADQTNLLALNAAIEAARAGGQGRGFAVVADEVRALAHRTQNSTAEVNEMINALKEGTGRTISVIEQSQAQSERTVETAAKAGETLQAITRAMDEIRDMTAQIASAAEEQTQVSETINQSIVRISSGSEETSSGAGEILNSTASIGTDLSQLMRLIRKFKVQQDDVVELEVARAAHQAWKLRLRAFLDGNAEIPHEQAVSSHDCDFGRWYYSRGLEHFGRTGAMASIEKPHDRMHQLIAEIIDARSHQQLEAAEAKYREVCELSNVIVAEIDVLIEQAR